MARQLQISSLQVGDKIECNYGYGTRWYDGAIIFILEREGSVLFFSPDGAFDQMGHDGSGTSYVGRNRNGHWWIHYDTEGREWRRKKSMNGGMNG